VLSRRPPSLTQIKPATVPRRPTIKRIMPFDPTLPLNNSPIIAAELRNQFNGLADLANNKVTSTEAVTLITANAAGAVDSVAPLDSSASTADVVDKINELLARLKRQ
jgi:hypothetical protein